MSASLKAKQRAALQARFKDEMNVEISTRLSNIFLSLGLSSPAQARALYEKESKESWLAKPYVGTSVYAELARTFGPQDPDDINAGAELSNTQSMIKGKNDPSLVHQAEEMGRIMARSFNRELLIIKAEAEAETEVLPDLEIHVG